MASTWQQLSQRASFTNRISTMFDRRRATAQTGESGRATTTFEVPLFLSPSRYEPPQARTIHREDEYARSNSSVESLMEAAAPIAGHGRPNSLPSSSRYSSPAPSPSLRSDPVLPNHEPSQISSRRSPERTRGRRRPTGNPQLYRRTKKRNNSTMTKLQSLKRLSFVFGITLFASLLTYLILAATGTASGIMFHVLMILLILSLTGVFAHSTIRFCLLSKRARKRRVERRRAERWHGQPRAADGSFFGEVQSKTAEDDDEHEPEKPIRIIMAEDEEAGLGHRLPGEPLVRHPPPVYGNLRSSKRINPGLVHWQKVPPSPLTPTYDEAMLDVRHVAEYRPPSYIESESGATRIVARGREDVDEALKNIHPLEREQVLRLKHNLI